MSNGDKKSCPSAVCEEGATLIGIVNKEGIVDFLPSPFSVDKEFVETAFLGRQPELRFRFSNRCVENGCRQWTGKSCSIIESVLESEVVKNTKPSLPKCTIRSTCRWYYQEGEAACWVCPLVITDNS